MARKCLDCGGPLAGRADKKYCSDMCRNNYNNLLNGEATKRIRNINNILRRNRRILSETMPVQSQVAKEELAEKGFNFTYYTGAKKLPDGQILYLCYEYGYRASGENTVTLERTD